MILFRMKGIREPAFAIVGKKAAAASSMVTTNSRLLQGLSLLARAPWGFSCCSVHQGANFAPRLGQFVGCHHQPMDDLALSLMSASTATPETSLSNAKPFHVKLYDDSVEGGH